MLSKPYRAPSRSKAYPKPTQPKIQHLAPRSMNVPVGVVQNIIAEDVVKVPLANASAEDLLKYLNDLLVKCQEYCETTVAHVNWTLIENNINAIHKHIWQNGVKYMHEVKGLLAKLCVVIAPNKIKVTITLTTVEYDTILFVLACLHKQSTKGRRAQDPNGLTKEQVKAKLLRKLIELTAADIKERMEHSLPLNIEKYFPTDRNTTPGSVVIRDKQYQSLESLITNFDKFMEQKKPPSSTKAGEKQGYTKSNTNSPQLTPQKRPRDTDSDSVEDSDQGPRKSLRGVQSTCAQQGIALAPPPVAMPPQDESTDKLVQQMQDHLSYTKQHNPIQYANTTDRLMSMAFWQNHPWYAQQLHAQANVQDEDTDVDMPSLSSLTQASLESLQEVAEQTGHSEDKTATSQQNPESPYSPLELLFDLPEIPSEDDPVDDPVDDLVEDPVELPIYVNTEAY